MLVLVGLCFFCSMWITNDVALLTFVPFTILVAAYGKTGSADDSGDYHGDDSCQSWKYGKLRWAIRRICICIPSPECLLCLL